MTITWPEERRMAAARGRVNLAFAGWTAPRFSSSRLSCAAANLDVRLRRLMRWAFRACTVTSDEIEVGGVDGVLTPIGFE
jgi:hypothetical protein